MIIKIGFQSIKSEIPHSLAYVAYQLIHEMLDKAGIRHHRYRKGDICRFTYSPKNLRRVESIFPHGRTFGKKRFRKLIGCGAPVAMVKDLAVYLELDPCALVEKWTIDYCDSAIKAGKQPPPTQYDAGATKRRSMEVSANEKHLRL